MKLDIKNIYKNIKIGIGYTLVAANTLLIFIFLLPVGLLKKYVKNKSVTKYCLKYLHIIGKIWIYINYGIVSLLSNLKWQITGLDNIKKLSQNDWYLLISNHQSWNDVFILQFLFNRYLPFQKYLVKEKMRKFPVMGFVWEAIDCPFLKRQTLSKADQDYSDSNKSVIKQKNNENYNDIELIKDKCNKFKLAEATIVCFPEGTRFTDEKHKLQQSPYNYLLTVKAGGVAAILEGMKNEIKYILDVSLSYNPRKFSFKDLFAGNIENIAANINVIPIPDWLHDCYKNNRPYSEYKEKFQQWLEQLWFEKDRFLVKNH